MDKNNYKYEEGNVLEKLFDYNNVQIAMPNYDDLFKPPISKETIDAINEANRYRIQAQQAQIDAAEDIAGMKRQMEDLIENQRIQIENQKKQIERQEKTIDQLHTLNKNQSQQLKRLKEIFYSLEDGTAVSKEMMKNLEKLLAKQPEWKDFIADKGADLVVGELSLRFHFFLKCFILPYKCCYHYLDHLSANYSKKSL